jgi:hypothetical protein
LNNLDLLVTNVSSHPGHPGMDQRGHPDTTGQSGQKNDDSKEVSEGNKMKEIYTYIYIYICIYLHKYIYVYIY